MFLAVLFSLQAAKLKNIKRLVRNICHSRCSQSCLPCCMYAIHADGNVCGYYSIPIILNEQYLLLLTL